MKLKKPRRKQCQHKELLGKYTVRLESAVIDAIEKEADYFHCSMALVVETALGVFFKIDTEKFYEEKKKPKLLKMVKK